MLHNDSIKAKSNDAAFLIAISVLASELEAVNPGARKRTAKILRDYAENREGPLFKRLEEVASIILEGP